MTDTIVQLGLIGLGAWGPNLLRNFVDLPQARVKWCCDLEPAALGKVRRHYSGVITTHDSQEVMDDAEVDAVVVSASAAAHYELARQALLAGKHVFVEKPLALRVQEGQELVTLASKRNLILMVGHLLLYHPAVRRLKEYVEAGELGEIYYVYSQRLNLGKIRQDENAMWSLAPHDISVALFLLAEFPTEVSAQGMAVVQPHIEDTVFLTLRFASGLRRQRLAHVHVSWLDPHRVRRLTVVGERKMAVFDDVETTEKLRLYDKGVDGLEYRSYGDALTLRFGDVLSPRIAMQEPLRLECQHFLDCVLEGQQPLTDGKNGLDVLRILEAGQRSLEQGGIPVAL